MVNLRETSKNFQRSCARVFLREKKSKVDFKAHTIPSEQKIELIFQYYPHMSESMVGFFRSVSAHHVLATTVLAC